ncbi:hypothetical protein [Thermotoga sp.]|nr:hypothetical protein [Thermotoga sp.]
MERYGTWSAIMNFPDLFAAAIPICGRRSNRSGGKFAYLREKACRD